MFILELTDYKGNILKEGDVVRVIGGRNSPTTFYAEVKYLEEEKAISPFHTFSFHYFEKAELPKNAKLLSDEKFKCWISAEPQKSIELHSKYLLDWRSCERYLEKCYQITKI